MILETASLKCGSTTRTSFRSFTENLVGMFRHRTPGSNKAEAARLWSLGREVGCQAEPVHVAAYVEMLSRKVSPRSVNQHLGGIRMLFDWMVTGQAMPSNPRAFCQGAAALGE
jgi:hypothetical protein